jgi:prolyl oligopeptidase
MGNMYVQRPDLFGAIHCAVPLLDMKRYHTLLAGASWMAEYGNPDTDDWTFLQKYSPYHSTSDANFLMLGLFSRLFFCTYSFSHVVLSSHK